MQQPTTAIVARNLVRQSELHELVLSSVKVAEQLASISTEFIADATPVE